MQYTLSFIVGFLKVGPKAFLLRASLTDGEAF